MGGENDMQKTWYKILAALLCIVMLVAFAPSVNEAPSADSEHAHSHVHTETRQSEAQEGEIPKAGLTKGTETHSDEPLVVGENTFVISEANEQVYRPFTAPVTTRYRIYSVSNYDTWAVMYNDQMNEIGGDDDSGDLMNFRFSISLVAGQTYYLRVSCPFDHKTGNVTVMISQLPENACGDQLTSTFHADTGELEILGSGDMWNFAEGSSPWYSFAGEILTLTLPEDLKSIGECAFSDCTALQTVEIPDGTIYAFKKCFSGCTSLTSVTIPISLNTIYESAFSGCVNISDVFYKGTAEQRDNFLYIHSFNDCLETALWHYLGLPCPHKNTYTLQKYGTITYEELEDDLWHRATYMITPYTQCLDCDEVISEETPYPVTYMYYHYYDESGICGGCGHVNQCKHLNRETYGWWSWEDRTYTDIGSDSEHQVSGQYCTEERCLDCGVYMNEQTMEMTGKEPHDYYDKAVDEERDTCSLCGHKNTCKHTATPAVRFIWDKYECEIFDAQKHRIFGEREVERYCPTCGKVLQTEWEYGEEFEDHDYDPYGYCRMCGYKAEGTVIDAEIVWNENDVQFKGTTAYVIANGKVQTPRFTVKNRADGSTIPAANYDFVYKENTNPGTGYLYVTLKNGYLGVCRGIFKIYLPATTETTVANVKEGIKITWKKVAGAAGYVIYRRAWSSTTNGWTDFVRWNNTTATTWTDGSDANHKVFAGTRYQYGIKAYFTRRTDPETGTQIGGNVGDNYNLGMVGPLKTTVRITTRKLISVTSGRKQMTVKWEPSSVFTGYQIQYATNSTFTQNANATKIADPKTVQTVIKNLTSGRTYYIRLRSYHVFNGMTYFGEWSNVMNCKVK